MSTSTLSFLIVHNDFHDTISYTIDESFSFSRVIEHVCSSFGFEIEMVEVRSSLGLPISDMDLQIPDILKQYGPYFKFIVHERSDERSKEAWSVPQYDSTTSGLYRDESSLEDQETFHDVLDDLLLMNSDNWNEDDKGYVEVTLVPNFGTFVTQMKVMLELDEDAEGEFSKVSSLFGMPVQDVIVTAMEEESPIVSTGGRKLREILEQFGTVFILYPASMREKIEMLSEEMAAQIRELIYKYKRD